MFFSPWRPGGRCSTRLGRKTKIQMGAAVKESQWPPGLWRWLGAAPLFGGRGRRQLKCMQDIAHLPAERIVNELVLADARQSLEGGGHDMGSPVVVISGKVGQLDLGVGQLCLDAPFDLGS
jgi:hypothetical protein